MSQPGFDVEALSGILGSISIACWVCVFTPQIIENFKRHSSEGLSVVFIVVWLLGDLFNILGGVLQGILPTMLILAVYYTLADLVLLGQVFYYRGFTLSDAPPQVKENGNAEHAILDGNEQDEDEETPLLARADSPVRQSAPRISAQDSVRRSSSGATSLVEYLSSDGQHLNPAVPLRDGSRDRTDTTAEQASKTSTLWSALFNIVALAVVCLAGALGWWISTKARRTPYERHDVGDYGYEEHGNTKELQFDVWGQIFGYLCAVLYLGSRVPQLLLNYRRKSTEGVSMLFFLFACVGNLTFVLSVFAYEPPCARWSTSISHETGEPVGYGHGCHEGQWGEQYGNFIAVNASWIIGSAGTLLLDMAVFAQFWMYRGRSPNEGTIRVGREPNAVEDER